MTTTVAAVAAEAAPPAKATTKAPAAADVAAAAATAELNIVNAYDITISKKKQRYDAVSRCWRRMPTTTVAATWRWRRRWRWRWQSAFSLLDCFELLVAFELSHKRTVTSDGRVNTVAASDTQTTAAATATRATSTLATATTTIK